MKGFLLFLSFLGLALSATVQVYDVRYFEDYSAGYMQANDAIYARLPTYNPDTIFVQFRVPTGSKIRLKVDACTYARRPSDEDIIYGRGSCSTGIQGTMFTKGSYDYYKYPMSISAPYVGFCITFLGSFSGAAYYFDSSYLAKEIDAVARVVYGSAMNADANVKLGVAYTIVNRSTKSKTSCYTQATKPSTFKYWKSAMSGKPKTACENAAKGAIQREYGDPSKGATHFYEGYNMPAWASGKVACAKIGNFKFFKDIPY